MSIKHDHTLNPVTALEFFQGPADRLFVLIGEGCYLKVFEADTSIQICQWQVFNDQTLHGIAVQNAARGSDSLQLVLWGGSSLILLRASEVERLLSQDVSNITDLVHVSSDWILDVAISPYHDDSCVLVTAHNTVLKSKLDEKTSTGILETLNSPSRSILYSARLVWESPESILVAAGTVFGEIITWNCPISPTKSCRILATFTGHEGSIFGVDISPPTLDAYGNTTRFLASCSDDRTIRIWDIYDTLVATTQSKDQKDLKAEHLRETGFGENGQDQATQNVISSCLAMTMGHASRIWRVRFILDERGASQASSVSILSFGEDSTTQEWAFDSGKVTLSPIESTSKSESGLSSKQQDSGKPAGLTHINTFAYHSGKHIWSTALKHSKHSSKLITGGADGKVSYYQPSKITQNLNATQECVSWDLEDILKALPEANIETVLRPDSTKVETVVDRYMPLANGSLPKKVKQKKTPKDSFNRYDFVGRGEVILTTTFGRVLLGKIDNNTTTWNELAMPDGDKHDLKPYSVIRAIPEMGTAILGGANGNIYLYRQTSVIEKIVEVEGKVADIFPLPSRKKCLDFVVTTLGTGSATYFSLEMTNSTPASILEEITFSLPAKFVVTSIGQAEDKIIMGSRGGSLAIYESMIFDQPATVWSPEDVGAGDAITSITPLSQSESLASYIITTGRNGVYSIFAYSDKTGGERGLYPVHSGTPPLGPNIENAWFEGSDLLLNGFKSKNFVVWNETQQREIMNIECGGAHRSYAYFPFKDEGGCFIYTKASKLYIRTRNKPSHQIIKPGGHGRETKACATSPDGSLVATGAEDTSIRIWRYHDSLSALNRKFESLNVIQKHSAGIQSLQFHGSKYLFSSGGNEEFFVWALHSVPGLGVGIICEAGCPDQSEERDLRIMGFEVSDFINITKKKGGAELLISLAYSDSTMRTYRYSKAKGFNLLAKGRYTSSCLMHIKHLKVSADELHLLTAATDGNLVVWKATSSNSTESHSPKHLVELSKHKLHQSTIKCLEVHFTSSNNIIIVVTGGDDNAIGVTRYLQNDLSLPPTSIIVKSAHAAAVTGLALVFGNSDKELRILSSSNDQRVKEWRASNDEFNTMHIQKVGDIFTSVADIGDVVSLRDDVKDRRKEKKVIVVGNGMEVFAISIGCSSAP